jgi:hypothetical protein
MKHVTRYGQNPGKNSKRNFGHKELEYTRSVPGRRKILYYFNYKKIIVVNNSDNIMKLYIIIWSLLLTWVALVPLELLCSLNL